MKKYLLLLLIGSVVTIGCDPEEPEVPNEEEVITTLTYTLVPDNGGDTKTFQFRDLDGDGGDVPVIEMDALEANTVYSGTIELLNEQATPVMNVSEEVAEEAEEHRFFYQSTKSDLEVTIVDVDSDNDPLGLETTLSTGAAGSGKLTILLRHEPDKSAGDDPDQAGGETDIEVVFNMVVQ